MTHAWLIRRARGCSMSLALKTAWAEVKAIQADPIGHAQRQDHFAQVREAIAQAKQRAEIDAFRARLRLAKKWPEVQPVERRGGLFRGDAAAFLPPKPTVNLCQR